MLDPAMLFISSPDEETPKLVTVLVSPVSTSVSLARTFPVTIVSMLGVVLFSTVKISGVA